MQNKNAYYHKICNITLVHNITYQYVDEGFAGSHAEIRFSTPPFPLPSIDMKKVQEKM